MTLRIRISIFVFCAVMLLTFGILFGEVDRIGLLEDRIESLTLENQVAAWESAVGNAAAQLTDKSAALVSTRELATAVRDRNNDLLQVLLASTAQDVARIDLLDGDGNLVYSTEQDINNTPLIDAGMVFKLMADNSTGTALEADQRGDVMVTVARPLLLNQDQIGILVVADRLSSVATTLKTTTGSDTVLLDAKGKPILSNVDAKLLPQLLDSLGKPHTGINLASAGGKVYRLGQTVVSSGSGNRVGYEVAVSDVTQSYEHDRSRQFLAYLIMIATVVGIQVALFLYLSRTFRPLNDSMAALNALSAGDTSVDIIGEERQDEVGRLAQLTHIVRDLKRDDLRDEQIRDRQRQRQERFIRKEMVALAGALNEEARNELLADLDRIEAAVRRGSGEPGHQAEATEDVSGALGSLAVAFRTMSERVRHQYQSLDKLVVELRDALATKTELIGLQQQFQIADQMRAAILPKTLPPRTDVEIEGRLLPATEFGGNFYDFFLLDDHRLFIVAAEVSGRDMAATFLTIVVRTLIKVMVTLDLSPSQAMARVNDMVLSENERRLEVRVLASILDLDTGRLSYSCAGFPQPFILRRLGEAVDLPLAESRPLGIQENVQLAEGGLDLPRRTTLVLASGGAIEALDPLDRPFGREGVVEALQAGDNLEARPVCNALVNALMSHERGRKRSDDVSCIALRYLGR